MNATLAASLVLKEPLLQMAAIEAKYHIFCDGFVDLLQLVENLTWKVESLPIFDNCTTGLIDLGCNPVALPTWCQCNCYQWMGPATVVYGGMITSNGCNRQQIFTYEATGVCGTNTRTRTYVWQESTPVILTCPINTVVPGMSNPNCHRCCIYFMVGPVHQHRVVAEF